MRELVLRMLRVPAEPHPPAGEQVRIFRAAPNFFRYRAVLWTVGQIGAVSGLVAGLITLRAIEPRIESPWVVSGVRLVEILAWISLLLQIPFTWMIMRLDYELRWYIVTDRSLRIRAGITRIVEKTMTFRNIQNISIRQGPIQRMLGIADLEVRTAGGGSTHGGEKKNQPGVEQMHVASFRGVDDAEQIRDLIRSRIRLHRDAGLGDPDEEAPDEALDEARRAVDEARALRRALESPA